MEIVLKIVDVETNAYVEDMLLNLPRRVAETALLDLEFSGMPNLYLVRCEDYDGCEKEVRRVQRRLLRRGLAYRDRKYIALYDGYEPRLDFHEYVV